MGYTILKDIDVGKEPVMFAAWPGVGNVGYIAAEFILLRSLSRKKFYFFSWRTTAANNSQSSDGAKSGL